MTTRAHGTRAKYVQEKCRCERCRHACRDYENWRTRQRAYGRAAYVDAEPVRAHMRALSAAGMGWKTAAARAGVPTATVLKLLYGCRTRGMAPSKRVRPRTAEALLAVTATLDDLADGARVPAIGYQRRLRALIAVGWSQPRLAVRMGMTTANFNKLLLHGEFVTVVKARLVLELYAELWDQLPDVSDGHRRGSVARARNTALAYGWAPPMAWDDRLIDDPGAEPDLGETGREVLDLAEVEHLEEAGAHITEIAMRLGCSVAAIEQARYRAARRAS